MTAIIYRFADFAPKPEPDIDQQIAYLEEMTVKMIRKLERRKEPWAKREAEELRAVLYDPHWLAILDQAKTDQ